MKKLLLIFFLTTNLSANSINFTNSSLLADKIVHISSSAINVDKIVHISNSPVFADKELCIPDDILVENAVAAAAVLEL